MHTQTSHSTPPLLRPNLLPLLLVLAGGLLAGCQSDKNPTTAKSEAPPAASAPATAPVPAAPTAPAAPVAPAAPALAKPAEATPAPAIIRIKAGVSEPYTDSDGNTWLSDRGFDGGEVVDRAADLEISNTKDPAMFRTEHFGMNGFSYKLPNGKYIVRLYFAETFEGIEGPGQRVFSFTVQGREFKDFDVWVKAGGPRKAYIETVNVDITNGELDITFKTNIENPEINAIEIIPAS